MKRMTKDEAFHLIDLIARRDGPKTDTVRATFSRLWASCQNDFGGKLIGQRIAMDRQEARRHDPVDYLAERAALNERIQSRALADGTMYVYEWGRDCDHYESDSVRRVTASAIVFEKMRDAMYDNAEGPCSMHIISESEANEYMPTRRDHVLEAFEDGHPHSVAL